MEELIKIVAQIAEQENQQPGHICIECSSNKKISPEIRYQTMLCICDTFLLSLIKEANLLKLL